MVAKRKLKLYLSFPFQSCRCAWLVHKLAVKDEVASCCSACMDQILLI